MNWRALRIGAAVVALWLHVGSGAQAAKFPGSVIDGETGKPLAGVWVIGHVMTGGGFVQGGSGCEITIAQSGEDGRYVLDTGGGLFGLLSHSSRPGEYLVKPGYREDARPTYKERDKKPFVMVPDRRSAMEQLMDLAKTVKHTDCGTDYVLENKATLMPFYRAAAEHARRLSQTRREWNVAFAVIEWEYFLEAGSWDRGAQRAREEEQSKMKVIE